MFTGIIECMGLVKDVQKHPNGNVEFKIDAPFADELILGQSIAHNGVCLTVTEINEGFYNVTAIEETLNRTNLGEIKADEFVNLERCMPANGRFDGHIVQGHVDTTGICEEVVQKEGSWIFKFSHDIRPEHMTIEKGSICVNGISLTVASSENNSFTVAIIPFTFDHTNLKSVHKGMKVNLEFDILGKYLFKMSQNITSHFVSKI
jgi:riboflavin synthase